MKHIIPVHLYKLHPEARFDPHSDVAHATIAHEMLEAAKGGHAVALEVGNTRPVMCHPDDHMGDLTARIADALAGPEPAEMGDGMDDEMMLNPDGTPMSKRQRAAARKAAEKLVGNQ